MEYFLLIFTGILVGICSRFFGIGGGVVLMPVLIYLYPQASPYELIGISLSVILLNTAANLTAFYKQRSLPPKEQIVFLFIGCLVGAIIGNQVASLIDRQSFRLLLGGIILVVIIKNLTFRKKQSDKLAKDSVWLMLTGSLGSLLASISGLGGGVIFLPLLQNMNRISISKLTIYSNTAMFFAVGNAVALRFMSMSIQLKLVLIVFLGTFLGSAISRRWLSQIPKSKKATLLNTLLLFLSIKILIGALA